MFNTFLYEPLYNTLIFLVGILPGHSVGLAVIVLTIIVKLLLLPLTHKSVKSQAMMKKIEPEAQRIREKHKNNKQEQAQKIMDLYKENGINPFSSCLLMFIQLPIIIALYWVFYKGLNGGVLYSFVQYPESVNMIFLGIFDLAGKSIIFAFLAGLTQFFQMKLSMPDLPKTKTLSSKEASFKDELARNMSVQMRYMMPVMIFFIAWGVSAVVALYWVVSNTFSIVQELIVKREADQIAHPTLTK